MRRVVDRMPTAVPSSLERADRDGDVEQETKSDGFGGR